MSNPGLLSPYENIVIGNFLYGVGLAIGAKSRGCAPSACASLLQQTPLDRPLADVLFQTEGIIRIFEFKRSENRSYKELGKLATLQLALQPFGWLQEISRRVHWYIESMPLPAHQTAPIKVCPYLDMGSSAGDLITLDLLVNDIAECALRRSSSEPTMEAVQQYFNCLVRVGGGSATGGGGFVVRITPAGSVSYAGLHDIRDLQQLDRGLLLRDDELHHRLEHDRDRAYALQRTVEQDRGKNKSRDLDFGR